MSIHTIRLTAISCAAESHRSCDAFFDRDRERHKHD
jgi:hypothetical protein